MAPRAVAPPRASAFSETDRSALAKIRLFAIVGILWIILGVIVPIFGGDTSLITAGLFGGNAGAASIASSVAFAVVGIIGFVLGIYAILKARSAFRDLSTLDTAFRTPARLMTSLFVGLGLFVLAFILIIAGVAVGSLGAVSSSSTSSFTAGPALGLFIGGGVLFVVAGIALLIGVIGMIIGLWRTGERYDNTLIKVGGILYIIPVVDIVAPILVYLGISDVQKRMPVPGASATSRPAGVGSGSPPPPPPSSSSTQPPSSTPQS
ncbi:MAG TPA: DUF973 family protein [Nitrososphaerales archaeon]|nr:DUF973 family protein [Nitrososphaerales archaeon]